MRTLRATREGWTEGFTLIELMIVVAIIAIIAAIAIPNLVSARLASNEASAVATLRTISSSQAQFHASAKVDVDGDGQGEYGWLRELSGRAQLRERRAGPPTGPTLRPAVLSGAFGTLNADGEVVRSGFHFKVFLPDVNGNAISEVDLTTVEASGFAILGDLAETMWSGYAWPAQGPFSGHYTFFVSHRGDVTKSEQQAGLRSGANGIEVSEAGYALEQGTGANSSMIGPQAIAGPGRDGNEWTRVN